MRCGSTFIHSFVPALALAGAMLFPFGASAIDASHYAGNSVLANGNWARVNVNEAGMHIITNSMLKNLGFSDPSKVRVYGYGGRTLPETLNSDNKDDLPIVPSLVTSKGIVFFAHGNMTWTSLTASQTRLNGMHYKHSNNPFSDNSYYFLSDTDAEISVSDYGEFAGGEQITSFTCRLVHEQDLEAPIKSGRMLGGEDFRSQRQRSFAFDLTDNVVDSLFVCSQFIASVTNGTSSLSFTANGAKITDTKGSTSITGVSDSSEEFTSTTNYNIARKIDNRLNFGITYSGTGAIFYARLNYIEVEYTRALRLHDGELYFYGTPDRNSTYVIEGCSEETVIWDVTDPHAPKKVNYSLSGSTATFNASAEYREFVAFNPNSVSRAVNTPKRVFNQNLHGMEAPDLLIISPDEFLSAAERLAEIRRRTDNLDVLVLTPETVYNEFSSGVPDITAFRKMLKMWKDRADAAGTPDEYCRYCLIMAKPTYDNKMVSEAVRRSGIPRVPIWQTYDLDKGNKSSSYSTDDYIGMLDDNGKSFNIGSAKIHVAVGRMPVKSLAEANLMVDKYESYLTESTLGAWRNNVLLISDDEDGGEHIKQSQSVYESLRGNGHGYGFLYDRIYLDAYEPSFSGSGKVYPDAKARMMQKINEGVSFISYIGHANPRSWSHENLFTWTDMNSMSNRNLFFLTAATCSYLRWDSDDVSGGEVIWLHPDAGCIGMICPSREVTIAGNGPLTTAFAKQMYSLDKDGLPNRIGDSYVRGKNANTGANTLRFCLMADPSLRMPSPLYNVSIDTVDGVDMTDASAEYPQLMARGKVTVTGHIVGLDGSPLTDFNGYAEIVLMDAERVIETNVEVKGSNYIYNDHKTRLFSGRAKVIDGYWSAEVIVPLEIENNYSPALLNVYAYDDSRREAHGTTERLYVYGMDPNAPEDHEGPEIMKFVLNGDAFTDGSVVNPNPVVIASFRDPSGINVSEYGVGHKLSLTLDDKDYFEDLSQYYQADVDDVTAGSVNYPLASLAPGEHTLDLTVWDNAGNSSTSRLSFNVDVAAAPVVCGLSTDVNPARTSVVFSIVTDRPMETLTTRLEVFDLNGRRVWLKESDSAVGIDSTVRYSWDLTDESGMRVPRGIYLYRATIETAEGASGSQTKKLAVAAE